MSSWTDLTREPMIAWDRIKAGWSDGWRNLEAQALATYEAMIVREPEAFRPSVEAFLTELHSARENLTRIAAKLGQLPPDERRPFEKQLSYLLDRWRTLASGVLADAELAVRVRAPAEHVGLELRRVGGARRAELRRVRADRRRQAQRLSAWARR